MFKPTIQSLAIFAFAIAISGRLVSAEELKCAGVISKIEGQIITVKTETAEHELTSLPSTKITLDNKPAHLTDLKVGYKVSCLSDKDDKKALLRSLDATTTSDKRHHR